MYTLCYVSNESDEINDENLLLLYEQTVENNHKEQITGVLLYKDGNFFQVLEGKQKTIKALFEKIKRDKRHTNLIVLFSKPSSRVFNHYHTGFSIIHNNEGLESLRNFLVNRKNISTTSACVAGIVKMFLKA